MNAKAWHQLIHWSESLYNDLPWRQERSLYGTLVSEIMLQQTTVATVRNKFPGFMVKFPTLASLAQATEDAVTIEWKGLGYYRRARNLKKAAEYFISHYGHEIPSDLETLKKAPGIGVYTANAIVAIGYNEKALAIDANIERVLSRLFQLEEMKGLALQRKIEQLFSQNKIVKGIKNFRGLNEALMDLGRIYCQARVAHCQACPVKKHCKAFADGSPLEFPKQLEKKKISFELELVRFLVVEKEKFLGYRKTEKQWLSGQVELPTYVLNCTDEKFNQYPKLSLELKHDLKKLPTLKTGITKYVINNKILILSPKEFKRILGQQASSFSFFDLNEKKENLAGTTIKILKKSRL